MSDMDPAAAAEAATGGVDGADAVGGLDDAPITVDGAPNEQQADTGGSRASLIDGLLETQPPGSVAEYPEMPDAAAHALIGAQKFINGIAGDRDMQGGKPAVVDFLQAAVSALSGGDDHADESPDRDPEPSPGPAGAIGGDIADE
ncbi:hypothetical protein EXE53_16695 [Halorubrum sp. SD626R]|uniref:hypothetical protein n=1 Tax=Halorubrum sp. SD626R TaxID=1419722 RepID=UPI0010F4AADC|nr:hypothetical protein [Halorubrum sp. SD626R]TKX79267.1 hypothetical protein EXE53_16695 [Halorubrum sp. SD626R]